MALAFIRYDQSGNNEAVFTADIGTSQFFRYTIGSGKQAINGMERINEVTYTSPMLKKELDNPFNSAFEINVPLSHFNRENKYIQLFSYLRSDGTGPAVSTVAVVNEGTSIGDNFWPALTLSQSSINSMNNYPLESSTRCRAVSFSFRESGMSRAMITDLLIEAAKVLAPIAVKAITDQAPSTAGNGRSESNILLKVFQAVIDAVSASPAPPAAPQPGVPKPNTQLPSPTTQSTIYKTLRRPGRQISYAKIIDGGIITGPAAIGLITTLAPALAPVLGELAKSAPQLLQSLDPSKLLTIISQEKLQKQKLENDLLTALLADANKTFLQNQLIFKTPPGISAPAVSASLTAQSKPKSQIQLRFDARYPLVVHGKEKYVYAVNNPLTLAVHVGTAGNKPAPERPIPKAIIDLTIRSASAPKILLQKAFRLKDVVLNSMVELPLDSTETSGLPTQTDLIITAVLRWPGKDQKTATSDPARHTIWISEQYLFKSTGESIDAPIALSDMDKFRVFWNKIWEGGAGSTRRWEASLDTRYYTKYAAQADTNARIESRLMPVSPDESTASRTVTHTKLKSGLEISPRELNDLIPRISSYPPLNQGQLKALSSEDLGKIFDQQASARLELKGRKEERGYVWTFPEIQLRTIQLLKVDTIDNAGQVTSVSEENVVFPTLNAIRFIGLKNQES